MSLFDNDLIEAAGNTPIPGEEESALYTVQAPDLQVPEALVSTPTSPLAATPPAPPTVQPGQTVKQGTSQAGSYRGITQQGLAATTALNKKADLAAQGDIARFQPQLDQERADYEAVAQQKRQANQLELDAHREHAAETQKLWMAQKSIVNEQHALEQQAYAQSQVVKQNYLANYEHDLMAVRQLAMQTGDPYERMSAGQAFGLIAQHAVAGFLKVGGHDLGIQEQTDRWVNREIAKHGQQVQDARQNAEGQMHLYNVARQQASDDYEARERFRGMVLEGLKTQIGYEAARYGSQLATATGAQKAAEIDGQLVALKANLGQRQQGLYFEAEKMRIGQAAQQAANSVAWHNAKTSRMGEERQERERVDKKNATTTSAEMFPVYDPFEAQGKDTQPKWFIDKDDKDAMSKFREKESATRAVAAQLDNLEALRARAYAKVGGAPVSGIASAKLGNAAGEIREYLRARTAASATIRRAYSGAAFTEAESKEYLSMLPTETFWESADNVSAIPQLREKIRTDFQASADSYSTKGKGNVAGPQRAAEHEAMLHGGSETQSVPGQLVEATDKLEKEKPVAASRAFTELMGSGDWPKGSEPAKMQVVETLATIYLNPTYARRQYSDLPENDKLAQAQAREALQRIAADSDIKDVYLAGFAQIILDKAESDPEGLSGLLGLRQVKVDESEWSMTGAPVNSGP